MEEELPSQYDVVVVGTGLVECVVAAAAARIGKKVLHVDKNDYYGMQWASFTLKAAQQWVQEANEPPPSPPTPTGECELKEGEKLVSTNDPSRCYSRVRQCWHVPKEALASSTVASTDTTIQGENTASGNTQQTTTQDRTNTNTHDTPQPATQGNTQDRTHTNTHDTPQPATQGNTEDATKDTQNTTQALNNDDRLHEQDPKTLPTGDVNKEEAAERKRWTQDEVFGLSRKFNLDLAPKLLYAHGPMVELLISSNIARYVEFKCITRVLTWLGGSDGGRLVVVPCSRSDVFTTSTVSLVEKRLLMKFLEFCHQFDQHQEEVQDYLDKPFVDFLRSRKLTDNLIHFVAEAIGMVGEEAGCKEGLERTKAFLTSLGRYGATPFLFSMYGSGELPQAFCRLCAVFEGIYILRKPVSSLIVDAQSNTCRGVVSEGQVFAFSHLVMSVSQAPSEYLPQGTPQSSFSRAIFLTDRSILPHEKEQLTLLRLPAKDGNLQPITVLEVGSGTYVCPKDLYCVHLTCRGMDAERDLSVAVDRLFTTETDTGDDSKPRVVWSLYFNQVDYSGCDLQSGSPANLYLCPGPNTDLDYDLAIEQARSIFSRMFPGEEFLPRAPDPDEISFDNHGTEPKEGDTFSGDGNTVTEDKTQGEEAGESDGGKNCDKVDGDDKKCDEQQGGGTGMEADGSSKDEE